MLAAAARCGHVGLTYEPCLPDGALVGARKGSGNFDLVVTGRAAHAGRDFAAGRNAVAAAADVAARLHALNGRREHVTLNIGRIDGGGPLNVVPGVAVLRFNVRVPDAAAAEWWHARVAALLASAATPDIGYHLHGGFHRPAKPIDGAQGRLMAAVGDVAALLKQPIVWRPSGGVCEGNNLYAGTSPLPATATTLIQGSIERSNVSGVTEMAQMMRVQRAYETITNLMSKQDDLRTAAVQKLGTLAA